MRKLKNKDRNKYSFYTVKKNGEFINLESSVSEDEKYSEPELDIDVNPEEIIDFFSYDDIYEEYCFATDECNLYRNLGDDKLALLYQKEYHNDGSKEFSIYTKNGFYSVYKTPEGFKNIFYMNSDEFINLSNMMNSPMSSIPVLKNLNSNRINTYSLKNATPVLYNYKPIAKHQKLLQEFKSCFMKYSTAAQYIPAVNILEQILKISHHYIATGELNENELLKRYMELLNFQKPCHTSIKHVSQLVYDPTRVDLRDFCNTLQYKINNIESLINLYLRDELEK